MVIFKDTVRIKVWTPALSTIFEVLAEIDEVRYNWCPADLTITSINDSSHMNGSRHYTNEAVDVRSKSFKMPDDKEYFRVLAGKKLGDKFTVLFENVGLEHEHFHIQVRKGTNYP